MYRPIGGKPQCQRDLILPMLTGNATSFSLVLSTQLLEGAAAFAKWRLSGSGMHFTLRLLPCPASRGQAKCSESSSPQKRDSEHKRWSPVLNDRGIDGDSVMHHENPHTGHMYLATSLLFEVLSP